MQVEQLGDERGDWRLEQGIAGGDIDLVDLIGQTVDNGLQQSFVAEHDGGAPSVGNALGCEPLADVSRLDVLGGG